MKNIFHNPDAQQINIMDERFYTIDGETFYPSVTTVLEAFPASPQLLVWKKSVGFNADIILDIAAAEGSMIHNAIERYLLGRPVLFSEIESMHPKVDKLSVWKSILRFVDFWETEKPVLETSEQIVVSPDLRLGGTVDITCMIDGQRWLIDAKSSNYVSDTHEFQLAAYATMWNREHPGHKIDRVGVLHLKALTRGPDKKGKKIQGKGWQLVEFDRDYRQAWQIFRHLRVVWDECNPDYRPANLKYPDRVQLRQEAQPT